MTHAALAPMPDTLDWYRTHAAQFAADADAVDLSALRAEFLALLPAGARVLDVGCGSGRDAVAFQRAGCAVTAIEPTEALARHAEAALGAAVRREMVQKLDGVEAYEGVWCCASLLHVPPGELAEVMARVARALVVGGVLYVSFKRGEGERVVEGRFFHDETSASLTARLDAAGFGVLRVWETPDARPAQAGMWWVNALARREG